ncbi:MAG: YceH family protein [Acidimicrobiales bacterium]
MVDVRTDEELRVLGALAEKEATVPDTYPMTLKGLESACNQKNNRDPITDLGTATIQRTLDRLKAAGLVRFVHPSHGARSTKYRHVIHERLELEPAELAVLTVLMLRGPQTLNEVRTRTERAHRFADLDEVEETLEDLAGRDEPLAVLIPRQPGQKEARWMHLLAGEVDSTELSAPSQTPGQTPGPIPDRAPDDLATRVVELEARVAALEGQLESVLADLGMSPSPP